MAKPLDSLYAKFGIVPHDTTLYELAFTHTRA